MFEQDLNFAVAKVLSSQSKILGLVVQLVRISACHAGGRGFESRPDRKSSQFTLGAFFGLIVFALLKILEIFKISIPGNNYCQCN